MLGFEIIGIYELSYRFRWALDDYMNVIDYDTVDDVMRQLEASHCTWKDVEQTGLTQLMLNMFRQNLDPDLGIRTKSVLELLSQRQIAANALLESLRIYYCQPDWADNGAPRVVQQGRGAPGCNLYIQNIPFDWEDVHLREAFVPFGTVLSATVYINRATNQSLGFGFVSYEHSDNADIAIRAMNGSIVGNRRLKVQIKRESTPRELCGQNIRDRHNLCTNCSRKMTMNNLIIHYAQLGQFLEPTIQETKCQFTD